MRTVRLAAKQGFLAGLFGALMLFWSPAAPTLAEEPPALRGDPATYADENDRLFGFLGAAKTEAEARSIEDEIWRHWFLAPDTKAAELMRQAMEKRSNYDFAGAVALLDELIAANPDWAEAWNQRATIRFMQGDFADPSPMSRRPFSASRATSAPWPAWRSSSPSRAGPNRPRPSCARR